MKSYQNMLFTLILLSLFNTTIVASPILLPAWETKAIFDQPESVVFNSADQFLYVSNVNGDPNEEDGDGYISKMSLSGEIVEQHWLTGLNAPKGLAIVNNILYVADINQLIVIDIKTKKIVHQHLAPSAKFLNDVAADPAGNIYVSDMLTNTIYRLANDIFSIWLQDEQLEYPNGLLIEGDTLLVASWGVMTDGFVTEVPGHLKAINIPDKTINSLGDKSPVGNLDGIEADGNGNYYVTDWMSGKLLHIEPSGISTTLLVLEKGSADQTILQHNGLIIIPMMLSDHIVAYKVSE
jgi:hypothetical protein